MIYKHIETIPNSPKKTVATVNKKEIYQVWIYGITGGLKIVDGKITQHLNAGWIDYACVMYMIQGHPGYINNFKGACALAKSVSAWEKVCMERPTDEQWEKEMNTEPCFFSA